MSPQELSFRARKKNELHELCDRLLVEDSKAVEECVAFLEAETFGIWHGRARAMMARRLKHRTLSASQRERLNRAVLGRLASGRFSEGFRDQLRLILHLDPERAFSAARVCQGNAADHVRRYATWVLAHERKP